jgi:hypothetical protein
MTGGHKHTDYKALDHKPPAEIYGFRPNDSKHPSYLGHEYKVEHFSLTGHPTNAAALKYGNTSHNSAATNAPQWYMGQHVSTGFVPSHG